MSKHNNIFLYFIELCTNIVSDFNCAVKTTSLCSQKSSELFYFLMKFRLLSPKNTNFNVSSDHFSGWHLYVGSYTDCHLISLQSRVWFRWIINPAEQTDTRPTQWGRFTHLRNSWPSSSAVKDALVTVLKYSLFKRFNTKELSVERIVYISVIEV